MLDKKFETLRQSFPKVQKNILLKPYTTFKIGGPAKYFIVVKTETELLDVIALARQLKIPIFILGGGSNLLVADKGFLGLVIKIELTDIFLKSKYIIEAGSGLSMKDLVNFSLKNSLAGLEWAGGLPGTFGGAIRGNAGAFGGEMKDTIFEVKILDDKLRVKKLSNQSVKFSYRNSLLKQKNWSVISATLKLKKGDLKELKRIVNARIAYRKKTHPLEFPNAGSVFKNVPVKKLAKKFQIEFQDKVKQDPFPIVPTAWLIIGAGITGKKIGRAQISNKHSNYIVNLGKARAGDVLKLITFAQKAVYKKYGVKLEAEIQLLK